MTTENFVIFSNKGILDRREIILFSNECILSTQLFCTAFYLDKKSKKKKKKKKKRKQTRFLLYKNIMNISLGKIGLGPSNLIMAVIQSNSIA